jgi:hypothetical protein
MNGNVDVYGKLRVCVRGFSEGKSDASKQSNSHWLSTKLAIFYIRCCHFVVFFLTVFGQSSNSFFLRFANQFAATVAHCFGESDVFFDFLLRKQAKSQMRFLFHI